MPLENHDRMRTNGSRYEPEWSSSPKRDIPRDGLILWRMYGATDELACVVRSTTFGYTLGLELAGQPILLELQSSVEVLVDKAARLEAWLQTQGWLTADYIVD